MVPTLVSDSPPRLVSSARSTCPGDSVLRTALTAGGASRKPPGCCPHSPFLPTGRGAFLPTPHLMPRQTAVPSHRVGTTSRRGVPVGWQILSLSAQVTYQSPTDARLRGKNWHHRRFRDRSEHAVRIRHQNTPALISVFWGRIIT